MLTNEFVDIGALKAPESCVWYVLVDPESLVDWQDTLALCEMVVTPCAPFFMLVLNLLEPLLLGLLRLFEPSGAA